MDYECTYGKYVYSGHEHYQEMSEKRALMCRSPFYIVAARFDWPRYRGG